MSVKSFLQEQLSEHRQDSYPRVCTCGFSDKEHRKPVRTALYEHHLSEVLSDALWDHLHPLITRRDQLDALPDRSVIQDQYGDIVVKDEKWLEPGGSDLEPVLPAIVISYPRRWSWSHPK